MFVTRILEEFQQPAIQTKKSEALWRIFHQIEVCQQKGRKDSKQAACRRMGTLESFFVFNSSEL